MGKKTECLALLYKEKVSIPYTMTWTDKTDPSKLPKNILGLLNENLPQIFFSYPI
jgi:hypothetical protein